MPIKNYDKFRKRLYSELSNIEYQYVDFDVELKPKSVNKNLVEEINKFQPFGIGFPSFKFKAIIGKAREVKLIGADNSHIKFKVDGIDCIGFSMSDKIDIINNGNFEIIYSPDINKFRGKESVQLMVKSIKERW
mgnify:CR=1 FL=1